MRQSMGAQKPMAQNYLLLLKYIYVIVFSALSTLHIMSYTQKKKKKRKKKNGL